MNILHQISNQDTSPGAEETKDSEPEENELSSLQEGTHLVLKRTDDNAENTLHAGKVISPYNSRDKSIEIQHFIDLGKSGTDFWSALEMSKLTPKAEAPSFANTIMATHSQKRIQQEAE